MEVVVHHRPSQNQQEELHRIAAGALEEFPVRPMPVFSPWFPCYLPSCALKPQICPPYIAQEDMLQANTHTVNTELLDSIKSYDHTLHLMDFQPNVGLKHEADKQTEELIGQGEASYDKQAVEPSKPVFTRSWSVCSPKGIQKKTLLPLSNVLKNILSRLELYPFHRGWWTIAPSMCGGLSLDEAWVKLNRVIKNHFIPSCNATMRREIHEIWVFCDLQYCEHAGTLLKEELKLTGRMDLCVRKHGVIFCL
ncbi:shieldin complex subunit 3 [Pelodytes ibericus]